MPPRFSIVMPAFNAERTIEATIRSVFLQTTADFELIVVDDGSHDATVERALGLADERVAVIRQQNAGPSAARNVAITRASGEYICPLDADDLLMPRFLETLGAALDHDDSAGFAYTDAWVLDDATGRVRRALAMAYDRPPKRPPSDPREFMRLLLERNFIYGCTVMRRSTLTRVGGYSRELLRSEDYELWLRMLAHGYAAAPVAGPLAIHRELASSNSTDFLGTTRSSQHVYELVATTYPVDDDLRRRAIALGERWRTVENRIVDPPTPRVRDHVISAAKTLRRQALDPFRWYRSPPTEVRWLLEATGN